MFPNSNQMVQALNMAYDLALNGIPGMETVEELADSYLKKGANDKDSCNELIKWQIAKATTAGFMTNMGGIITMPVGLPTNLMAVFYIQIRMIAAIAVIGGHNVKSDRVKTLVLLCLCGSAAVDIIKKLGITIGQKSYIVAIRAIPGVMLTKINQAVGYRLITKFGTTAPINLWKWVPLVSGVIAGALDGVWTSKIGKVAMNTFLAPLDQCCGTAYSDASPVNSIVTLPSTQLIKSSSLYTTSYSSIFGFADIQARVSVVDRYVLNTIGFDFLEMEQYIKALRLLVMRLRIYIDKKGSEHFSSSFSETLDRCNAILVEVEETPALYDDVAGEWIGTTSIPRAQSLLDRACYILRDIITEQGSALKIDEIDIPRLTLIRADLDGVFLPNEVTACGTTFPPGCYVASDASDMDETTNHELAHAYMYIHRKRYLRCKYIEEGLAEYAGKFSTNGGAPIMASEVSPLRYYNFLEYVRTLPPTELRQLAEDWILGTRPEEYWCQLTAGFR